MEKSCYRLNVCLREYEANNKYFTNRIRIKLYAVAYISLLKYWLRNRYFIEGIRETCRMIYLIYLLSKPDSNGYTQQISIT